MTLNQDEYNSLISKLISNMSLDENLDDENIKEEENKDEKQNNPKDQQQKAEEQEQEQHEMSIDSGFLIWKMKLKKLIKMEKT